MLAGRFTRSGYPRLPYPDEADLLGGVGLLNLGTATVTGGYQVENCPDNCAGPGPTTGC